MGDGKKGECYRWVVWWKRNGAVGCFGNLSGTHWVIVIRPQLSRSATTIDIGYTSNGSSVSILYRSMRTRVSYFDDSTIFLQSVMQTLPDT